MTDRTRLAGDHVTELQLQMAREEMLTLAREKMAERGCSLLEALGLIDSELRQKVRNQDIIAGRGR